MYKISKHTVLGTVGWHRIAVFNNYANAANYEICINTLYSYAYPMNMILNINSSHGSVDLSVKQRYAVADSFVIDKARIVRLGLTTTYYIDIHYLQNSVNGLTITLYNKSIYGNNNIIDFVEDCPVFYSATDVINEGESLVKEVSYNSLSEYNIVKAKNFGASSPAAWPTPGTFYLYSYYQDMYILLSSMMWSRPEWNSCFFYHIVGTWNSQYTATKLAGIDLTITVYKIGTNICCCKCEGNFDAYPGSFGITVLSLEIPAREIYFSLTEPTA